MKTPTPRQILISRLCLGYSTAEAAEKVYSSSRAWQQWEAGDRKMKLAVWELYLLQTSQHPDKSLVCDMYVMPDAGEEKISKKLTRHAR